MLSALQTAMTETDKQGEAKQQSILHVAIHFIYNTLAPDEQGLLLCLAPLKFAININTLSEYSQRLQQHAVLAHLPFDNWEKVLDKIADWELLRLYPDVLLQSAFGDFLRSRLGEKASLRGAIEIAFDKYYGKTSVSSKTNAKIATLQESDDASEDVTSSLVGIIKKRFMSGIKKLYRHFLHKETIERYYGNNDLSMFEDYLANLLHFAGGREKELAQVQSLLASDGTGIILVEGLSGYGKTTFVAQLKEQLKATNEKYIWHLFSRSLYDDLSQDQTRFDNNLADQLAWLLNEDIRKIKNKNGFVTDALRNPPDNLIVIIDALDETDPRFLNYKLPKTLTHGLKVIVTARKIGSDQHINAAGLYRENMLSVIEMNPLMVEEVVGLLNKLNMPTENAAKIVEISKGDPFYTRFLVEDIASGKLDTQNLSAYPPSLEPYLENQFNQLSEGAKLEVQAKLVTQIVLSAIPIPKKELISTIAGLENINFDAHFKDVRRFFIETERGYVVCHNRFKEFFVNKING